MSYTTNVVSNVTKIKDKIVASFCVVTVLCVFVLLMWCFVRANNARGQALVSKIIGDFVLKRRSGTRHNDNAFGHEYSQSRSLHSMPLVYHNLR